MPQGSAQATERTTSGAIGIDGQPFKAGMRTGVEVEGTLSSTACHRHPRRDVGPRVHDTAHGNRRWGAILAHAETQVGER